MNDDDDFKIEELLEKPLLSSQEVKDVHVWHSVWLVPLYYCTFVCIEISLDRFRLKQERKI